MDDLRILRLWAAAAWADGELHPTEAEALRRLIAASDGLGPEQQVEAEHLLKGPPSVDLSEVRRLPPPWREGVYRAAIGIVKLDRKVTDDERAFLSRLRGALDLDEAVITRIEKELGA